MGDMNIRSYAEEDSDPTAPVPGGDPDARPDENPPEPPPGMPE